MGAVFSKLGITHARVTVTLLLYAARDAVGRWLLRLPFVSRFLPVETARNAGWLGVLALCLSAMRSQSLNMLMEGLSCFMPPHVLVALTLERMTFSLFAQRAGVLCYPNAATASRMRTLLKLPIAATRVQPLQAVQTGMMSNNARVKLTYDRPKGSCSESVPGSCSNPTSPTTPSRNNSIQVSPEAHSPEYSPMRDASGSEAGTPSRSRKPKRPGPRSVIIKCVPSDLGTRLSVDGKAMFEREIRFYEEIAPLLSGGLSTPTLFFARRQSSLGQRAACLVLEDLTLRRDAKFLVPLMNEADLERELPKDGIRDLVQQLAVLHAAHWQSRQLSSDGNLAWAWRHTKRAASLAARQEHFLYQLGWLKYRRHFPDEHITPSLRVLADALVHRLPELYEHTFNPPAVDDAPVTLIHGELGLYNIMFHRPRGEQSMRACIFDWQTCGTGRAAYDLAFFLSFSVPSESRASQEEELLRLYWKMLQKQGVKAASYSYEHLHTDYSVCLVTAFAYLVSSMGHMPEQYIDHLKIGAHRAMAAIEDNHAAQKVCGILGIDVPAGSGGMML